MWKFKKVIELSSTGVVSKSIVEIVGFWFTLLMGTDILSTANPLAALLDTSEDHSRPKGALFKYCFIRVARRFMLLRHVSLINPPNTHCKHKIEAPKEEPLIKILTMLVL